MSIAHPLDSYSYSNFIAYVLYAPLFIAGPIMTFNDFMWQVRLSLLFIDVLLTVAVHSFGDRRPSAGRTYWDISPGLLPAS